MKSKQTTDATYNVIKNSQNLQIIVLLFQYNKTECHDITEILLKVALNTMTLILTHTLSREWFISLLYVHTQ
jgi:hypothetical protein